MKLPGSIFLLATHMLLTACASTAVDANKPEWLDKAPDVEITDIAKSVLRKNEGNILSPESATNLRPLGKPLGWAYRMSYQQRPYDEELDPVYVLTATNGHDYFFESISPFLSGAVSRYKWTDGRMFKYRFGKYEHDDGYEATCKFKLGVCEYKGLVTRVVAYTEYDSGVWTRKEQISSKRFLTDYVTRVEIYDASGLPLYRQIVVHNDIYKSSAKEFARTEYQYSGMDDGDLKRAVQKGAEIREAREKKHEAQLKKKFEQFKMGR